MKVVNRLMQVAAAAVVALSPLSLSAQRVMVQDNPWSEGAQLTQAMTTAFGEGNFTSFSYADVNAATLFSSANSFIYLEGGDFTAFTFTDFITVNSVLITNWVNAGGSLFLNAAPNEGGSIVTPFGTTIKYEDFSTDPVTMAPVLGGGTYNGNYFAHSSIVNGGTTLATDANGLVHLAGKQQGAGYVLTGGLTTPNFHAPTDANSVSAIDNYANILKYGASMGQGQVPVPEPTTASLVAVGLAGLAAARRRKKLAA